MESSLCGGTEWPRGVRPFCAIAVGGGAGGLKILPLLGTLQTEQPPLEHRHRIISGQPSVRISKLVQGPQHSLHSADNIDGSFDPFRGPFGSWERSALKALDEKRLWASGCSSAYSG